ncbi:RagB/SusD family nutrient uptake outer membrane protein [Mucilaginibacter mali]|uniref:RagB/SusD family nutrient uptake outer membrane protein n=1 Tax=Mucilaginibacter mali TaxID=2740462 RepID=A0A7D4Q250_9SPHI|nr:RagB/SusD family nutrient uptake outer membrane protein [Mucilaginibacter mali]QKJ31046.1 RagB/SusD family nutrient uptake outer membrane protein [Mucilaginibacter mali]
MKSIKIILIICLLGTVSSCKKYLDIVPDNIATVENAFTLRSSAEKFLFTCYSYMPKNGLFNNNIAFNGGDEVWYMDPIRDVDADIFNIAKGLQNPDAPLANYWSGAKHGTALFDGIRNCNIFLDNIGRVPDINEYERQRWIGEVTFLKAYYTFCLVRMYGPVPLMKVNLPISASPDEVQVYRDPVDDCFDYIRQLLNDAAANQFLPDRIINETSELGRISRAIVLAFKAKVLVTAASPLFNGNTDYTNFVDNKGRRLFNTTYVPAKWDSAATACKTAIDFCQANGYALSKFAGNTAWRINDTIKLQLDIRTALTAKVNNTEVIWPALNSHTPDMQRYCMADLAAFTSTSNPKSIIAPPLKMVELFYSKNGVPVTEDKTYDYANKYALRTAGTADRFYVKNGEKTVALHYDREPRFYADLGFDRGVWFGNWYNNYDVNVAGGPLYVMGRKGEPGARQGISNFSITSYYIKKLVSIESTTGSDGNFASNIVQFAWPEMRMADLYLLYAEALNEKGGPSPDVYLWINQVRARAGLNTVESSWTNFSSNPTKFQSKDGLREIIQRERNIELAFEGQRYWDLRRWKTAHIVLNNPIKGWDITQADAPSFYKEVLLYNQRFALRDYLWPIETAELRINKNLVQNPGW